MATWLRRAGVVVGILAGLVLVLGSVTYLVGSGKVSRVYQVETAALVLPTDAESVERGAHLTRIHGCVDCHGEDLSGQVMVDAPPLRATAANLTAGTGGVGAHYDAEDFDRAIRHGVKADGRSVLVMPSAAYHQLSDADAAALIAYLRQVPPVDNVLPPTEMRLPGRLLAAALLDPASEVRVERASTVAPPLGPTAEYGAYLASVTCSYCHGPELRGLVTPPEPGSPPSPDLRAAGQWPLAQFKETLRTGILPSGAELNARFMPVSMTRAMTDVELEALHAHLAGLPQ